MKRRQFLNFFSRELNEMKLIIERGDSDEQIMMANALLKNRLVRTIEKSEFQCETVHKSDEEIAKAVCTVEALFAVSTQWTAVYRVLVDCCGWDDCIKSFVKRMNAMLKGKKLGYPCTYTSIQRCKHGILDKKIDEWKKHAIPTNDHFFKRQLQIAEKLLELLGINV